MAAFEDMISYGYIENKMMHPHCNPGMELVLVEQGQLEWAVEQVPEFLTPGTVFFTLPWQMHGSLRLREPRNRIFFALFGLPGNPTEPQEQIRFPERLGFSRSETEALSRIFITAPYHAWPASEFLQQLFPEFIQRLNGSSALDVSAAITLLRSILIELADMISTVPEASPRNTPTAQRVHAFLQEINAQLDRAWTLEEMAEACGIKRTQFAKVTQQLTGYPPLQYLNRIRFEKACDLLGNSEASLTEIAFACGYSSSQYFSETFKKQARLSPSEYRRSLPELNAILESNWSHPEWRSVSDEQKRAARLKVGPGRSE